MVRFREIAPREISSDTLSHFARHMAIHPIVSASRYVLKYQMLKSFVSTSF